MMGFRNNAIRLCALLAVLIFTAVSVCAQSLDASTPAPVRSNSVEGRIAARDIGDSRMTNHYFAFTGTPGDLLITVQAQNLNGDIDVFTAGTLRPLLKLTLYADSPAPLTKGIYLRKRESLVLRIEARSPNDDEGTYRLSFGGSFEPIVGGPDIAESETAEAKTETPVASPGTRRVSSVGARINEPQPPPTEVAATPTPEPTPEAKPVETPEREVEKPAEPEAVKPPPARNPRGRRPPPRRTTPRSTETARTTEPARSTETARKPADKPKPAEPKPEEPKPEPAPETGPRLVIETSDGTLINRPMSGVKRVTVENGQVVIVGRDGKINRVLLADVVRMTIAP